jgi:hypothetical protein
MLWSLLVLSLPSQNTAARMRAWRALKALGAGMLRDGVSLLPEDASGSAAARLEALAEDVRRHEGSAHVLVSEAPETEFAALFDRSADYAALLAEQPALSARKFRKAFEAIAAVDFFPGEAQAQAALALQQLEVAEQRSRSPGEPQPSGSEIPSRRVAEHQGRVWATRARPWVDRLACAWLIRRQIDASARILWLADARDCPPEALGFDFDGAPFSHVGARVSFETMLASFGLEAPALNRLGRLVHALDVGGVALPPEAPGVESVLAGLRSTLSDDDALLQAACAVFDALITRFTEELSA